MRARREQLEQDGLFSGAPLVVAGFSEYPISDGVRGRSSAFGERPERRREREGLAGHPPCSFLGSNSPGRGVHRAHRPGEEQEAAVRREREGGAPDLGRVMGDGACRVAYS